MALCLVKHKNNFTLQQAISVSKYLHDRREKSIPLSSVSVFFLLEFYIYVRRICYASDHDSIFSAGNIHKSMPDPA
jgi:hypothetical protein